VVGCFEELLLYLTDHFEHVGLVVVVPVDSLAQVDLLLRDVLAEGLARPEDGVLGSEIDVGEEVATHQLCRQL
jgi:hypothetical protein